MDGLNSSAFSLASSLTIAFSRSSVTRTLSFTLSQLGQSRQAVFTGAVSSEVCKSGACSIFFSVVIFAPWPQKKAAPAKPREPRNFLPDFNLANDFSDLRHLDEL